jgi:trigger factor
MKAVVEPLEGNKVKLSIEVDEQEFEKDIDAAFRKISREVRVPGFRPGKAPRRILEARFGKETGRVEALREALPNYYSQAVRDNEVDVVAAPEIDITAGQEAGPISFDAVVEIRPQIQVAGYTGLRVVIPNPVATEEDIDSQVDRLRANFGELQAVDRPAKDGDHLTIDLSATRDGEIVSGLTTDDFLYELGSGTVLPEMDEKLQGAKVGDILAFEADPTGGGSDGEAEDGDGEDSDGEDSHSHLVEFKVLVKDVKEKILPEVTDDWASEASEFDTVAELRSDIARRTNLVRRLQANMAMRDKTLEALIELVDLDPPQSLVDPEIQRQLEDLARRLQQQGISLSDYIQATGQSGEDLVNAYRGQAESSVKADLALRAVAEAEAIEASEEDIEAEIERLAQAYQLKAKDLRRNLERADQMPAVRSDWKKTKALEWLIEHVEIVDAEGQTIDRELLKPDVAEPEVEEAANQGPGEGEKDDEPSGTLDDEDSAEETDNAHETDTEA